MMDMPRYIRCITVETEQLDRIVAIVEDVIPTSPDVIHKGNNMHQVIFYASELEYDIIADEINED